MAHSASEAWDRIQQRLAQKLRELPAIMGEEAVNYSLDAFQEEGWDGQPWPKRKNPTAWGKPDETDRALLVKTAKLKRSIRVSKIGEGSVTIQAGSADVPYANDSEYFFTSFIKKSADQEGCALFVSQNQHHQPADFPIDCIHSLA